jgi:hypothetical protein
VASPAHEQKQLRRQLLLTHATRGGGTLKLLRCWACNALIAEPRMELHHVAGKEVSDVTLPLCILCHDLVDRLDARAPGVFAELACLRLPQDRRLRLFLLKIARGYGLTLSPGVERHLLMAARDAVAAANVYRARHVHQEIRRHGKRAGRKRTPFDVNRAVALRSAGAGWRAIAKEVGVSYQTVRRESKRPLP